MKKNINITFCAMMSALSVVFMLLSYFPYLTYAIPAVSGLFIMVIVIEINKKWAALAYLASAIIVFFIAEPESKILYICLFGYYPILKALIEALKTNVLEWLFKILSFNIAVLIAYFIFSKLFSISLQDFEILGEHGAFIFLGLGNIVFILYDIAVSRVAAFYINTLHYKIKKLLL